MAYQDVFIEETTGPMSQRDMLMAFIIRPIFIEPFRGLLDMGTVYFLTAFTGVMTVFGLDLFTTPSAWWKALAWLVVIDWAGGIINAIRDGRFTVQRLTQKWYQAAGYVMACGSAAVLANAVSSEFPGGSLASFTYNLQFAVYLSFYIKEFISILKTWKLLTLVAVVWEWYKSGELKDKSISDLADVVDKLSKRKYDHQ